MNNNKKKQEINVVLQTFQVRFYLNYLCGFTTAIFMNQILFDFLMQGIPSWYYVTHESVHYIHVLTSDRAFKPFVL